ncbi:hypothetical protein SAMN02800692_2015 [Luteibacter sp. UNC138MFCol5.1]|uniref:hypothetical protein n=1 Tax=Luteibacter sp. UNC138MFCol5.1 TaxID=1502774 RepID=UPI0008AA8378|nr:hypothetical protein [Luteibacter sp. UNC138MFCol5.1]SEO76720.1 hypothetical protein SAMN02800692_2015 [Luteibacter sp. UNC138MFCol5.1]
MTGAVVVNSVERLQSILGDIREAWGKHHYLRVTIKTGKDRTLDQNAISHAWYEQIARELREDTAEGVKAECKLRFGVPILRAGDEEFREMYDASIRGHLSYEQKLKAMRFIPVTSLMTTSQLSQYLEDVQREYAGRGVMLEFPEDARPRRRFA